MSRRTISQREARSLKQRVHLLEELERGRSRSWSRDYPGGTHLGSITRDRDWLQGRIEGARMLGHAIVVTTDEQRVNFYALPMVAA